MSKHELKDIDEREFEDRIRIARHTAVVGFWAPWCEPCGVVNPMLERLAATYGEQVDFFRMNIDDNTSTPARYSVHSVPTVLFFKNGTVANQIIGIESEEIMEAAVRSLL